PHPGDFVRRVFRGPLQLGLEPQPIEICELQPGARLEPMLKWTAEHASHEIAWVGHAPDVNLLASQLIGAKSEAIRFAKGAVAAIEFPGSVAAGAGELVW